ncbi:MAG TPA: hypothetical protein VK772_01460, partial [Puia sp.]|nr:hypothetical protein [Puia sp.]
MKFLNMILLKSASAISVAKTLILIVSASISFLQNGNGQAPPPTGCTINGQTPVTQGDTWTYTLSGCTATSWTTTCGTIQSSTSTSVTIYFNILTCSSALITAVGTTATKTVVVNTAPLNGGYISNTAQTINYGATPAQINAIGASYGNCSGSYTYQWYSSPDNTTYTSISGATGQNYQPPALTATTYYKRKTTCSSSTAWTSNIATITVYPQVSPGTVYYFDSHGIPTETISYNASSGEMEIFDVSGGNGTYSYQWQSSPDNTHWTAISGQTGTTYTSPNLTTTTYYNVTVSSNGTTPVNSGSFEVIVNPLLIPGSITPNYFAIPYGSNPGTINGIAASGGGCSGSYTYQWQSSTNGTTYTNISGATSTNYTPPGPIDSAIWYRRKVGCSIDTAYTNTSQVTIVNSNTNLNFIRMRSVLKAGVTDTVTADGLTSAYDVAQSTQYFDGVGR